MYVTLKILWYEEAPFETYGGNKDREGWFVPPEVEVT